MRKSENTIKITIELPKNFKYSIERTMEHEWKDASKKWQVRLGSEDKEKVMRHAKNQLQSKVSFLAKNPWDLEKTSIVISVNSMGRGAAALNLPESAEEYNISLIRANEEWRLCDEPSSKTIPLAEFQAHVTNEIATWARTAVFYGVGSFTN